MRKDDAFESERRLRAEVGGTSRVDASAQPLATKRGHADSE